MGKFDIKGSDYAEPVFKRLMNARYGSEDALRQSVADLDKRPYEIDRSTMEYGQYQPILVPFDQWPSGAAEKWRSVVGEMRIHLMEQDNKEGLPEETGRAPMTRCGLLDAAIRKCFNSTPPIPFAIDVCQQEQGSENEKTHTIMLGWDHTPGSPPRRLTLTIICPYGFHPGVPICA